MFPNIGRKPFWITSQFRDPYLSRSCTLFPLSTSLVQFGPLVCFIISFVFSILHHARIIPRFGSEDCRTLVLIQKVTLLYSFNVQLSPILRCSLTFLTPLHFRTNKLVDFISAPHPLEWPSGNSIEWPSTDWPKMVLLFMLNLLLSTGVVPTL